MIEDQGTNKSFRVKPNSSWLLLAPPRHLPGSQSSDPVANVLLDHVDQDILPKQIPTLSLPVCAARHTPYGPTINNEQGLDLLTSSMYPVGSMTTAINVLEDGMNAIEVGAVRQIIPHFNFGLVVASIVVSLIGAFTSTQLICCARTARTFLGVLVWTTLSSFVFGFCAVFCIHEIAMLACELDVPVGIDLTWTVISASLATVFTFAALASSTFREFDKDRRRKRGRRYSLSGETPGHMLMDARREERDIEGNAPPGNNVSAASNGWGNHKDGDDDDNNNNNIASSGTEDTMSDTRSDDGLLNEEHVHSSSEQTVYGSDSQKLRKMSLTTFMMYKMRSLLKTGTASAEPDNQDTRTQKPLATSQTSFSDFSGSSITPGLGHLPRTQEPNQLPSSNVFVVTVVTVYAGLTIGNILKGLLWSASLTSMHYCGLLSLKIPNGYVIFNPALVVVAASICWVVCIVGAICMENMTDMLAQQLLFSVVATFGCAALHWTGMWSATFLTSSPPSDIRGYPIALPFLVATIAIVTCLAANFLLVHSATVSRNKLAEIVLTRRELWRTIALKESAEAAAVARTDFIASASHEIRTPLHHLQGFGDLLARREDLSDEARALLQSIQGATKTLSSITNNVLDWSRIENDKAEYNATTFNIRSACDSVVNLLPHKDEEAELEVFVVVTPVVPQNIYLDEGYLHRITMNLLSNAMKFTKYGYIMLALDVVNDDLVITVKDTGHGMPAAFLPIMFEPFKQAQSRAMSRGTGLGLSIIKQLVHQMHGTIQVESEYEKDVGEEKSGTTFTVTIPLPQLISSSDEDAVDLKVEAPPQIAILKHSHNSRAFEGSQLAWETFRCQTKVVKPTDYARTEQNSNTKWKYVVADVSILEQEPSVLLALRKNISQLVLVPYNEQSDLHGLPKLPAHLVLVRKPLVWHTFETRIAAVKGSAAKDSRSVRFADDASIGVPKNKVALSPIGNAKQYTILLVEDNPINAKLGLKMLTALGYNVILAEDGDVGIEQLRRHDELIDVVLMDQFMPRKDGVTATREIRAMEAEGLFVRSPRTIIAVTAGVGPHAQTLCQEAGMDDFLTKPLSMAKLEDVMTALLPA